MSSQWDELQIEHAITSVLTDAATGQTEHHFGTLFLSAYQLAIEFAQRYPEAFDALDLPVGGTGTGQRSSLAQYLARELSQRIKRGQMTHIEGAFLSNQHVRDFIFEDGQQEIRSSLTGTKRGFSMFRLRANE